MGACCGPTIKTMQMRPSSKWKIPNICRPWPSRRPPESLLEGQHSRTHACLGGLSNSFLTQ